MKDQANHLLPRRIKKLIDFQLLSAYNPPNLNKGLACIKERDNNMRRVIGLMYIVGSLAFMLFLATLLGSFGDDDGIGTFLIMLLITAPVSGPLFGGAFWVLAIGIGFVAWSKLDP